ncbi:MAG TPA: IS5 family transposase [Methanoregulaceae archaeon]|nr:IS5 family transposase [Methanoregulaceae archaeon]
MIGYDGYRRIRGSKISLLVERHGRPIACVIVPANVHDATAYHHTLAACRISRPRGRPITRPGEILADAAYDTQAIRRTNRRRGIRTMIPVNRRKRKKSKQGRPYRFDHEQYATRTVVERCFSWLKAFRKLVPRYERLEQSFRGLVIVACTMIVWRVLG